MRSAEAVMWNRASYSPPFRSRSLVICAVCNSPHSLNKILNLHDKSISPALYFLTISPEDTGPLRRNKGGACINAWFGDFNLCLSTQFAALGVSNPILFRASETEPPNGAPKPPSDSGAYAALIIILRYIPPLSKFFFRSNRVASPPNLCDFRIYANWTCEKA